MLGVDPQHQLENVLGIMIRLCPFCLCTFHGLHPATRRVSARRVSGRGFSGAPRTSVDRRTQGVLALLGQGRTTGLVLDSGEGVTHCVARQRFALPFLRVAWEKASPNRPNQEEFIFGHPDTPSSFKMKEQLLSDTAWHGTSLRSFIYT